MGKSLLHEMVGVEGGAASAPASFTTVTYLCVHGEADDGESVAV